MPTVRPYPHYVINVMDNSIFDAAIASETLPIHRPLYFMRTRKGPVGVPVWCNTKAEAVTIFGGDTFDPLNKTYFSDAALFLNETFKYNGAFIVRAAESDSEGTSAEQLISSTRVVYATYNIPESGSATVTISTEELADAADFKTLAGDTQTKKYPLVAFRASSPGKWGDLVGFRFFYDNDKNKVAAVTSLQCLRYGFTPVQKTSAGDIATVIADKFGQSSNQVMMKPDQIDPDTGVYTSFQQVVEGAFATGKLPVEIYVYHESFKTIGGLMISEGKVTDAELGLTSGTIAGWDADQKTEAGHLVNILTGVARTDAAYAGITVTNTVLSDTKSVMLSGGQDGLITNDNIEHYITTVCSTNDGEIPALTDGAQTLNLQDSARYPFTHVFDTGYTVATKKALMDVLDWREDVKAIISTQAMYETVNGSLSAKVTMNTQKEDRDIGFDASGNLRDYALTKRESILMGTEACRVTLVSQAGRLLTGAKPWVPLTLWHASKKAQYQSKQYMDREPKGLPYSAVEMFSELNWTPSSEDTKADNWDGALNYVQYYSRNGLHYASIRSVYKYDTSVLVDDIFTDAIVYSKHAIRQLWAKYAGVTRPAAILQAQIAADATTVLGALYNNKYVFSVAVTQNADEKKIGYIQHVTVNLTSPATNRVWLVDIVCNRENYTPTTA